MAPFSLPMATVPVDRMKIAWMAVAINDPNPIHVEDAIAQRAGFPGVIAHGTFAIGAMGIVLARWAGQQHVRHLETRLLAPVFPGDQLVCQGVVENVEENQAVIRFQVLAGERQVASGKATVTWSAKDGAPPWLQSTVEHAGTRDES